MSIDSLTPYLILSAGLFCTGLMGILLRRNIIIMLAGVELMLNAANINFVAFWRFHPNPDEVSGMAMVVFAMAIAAAEAAVGLALVISIYRHYRSTNPETLEDLKG